MFRLLSINLLLFATISSQAGEFTGTLRVIPEYHSAYRESSFFVPEPFHEFSHHRSRQEFEGHYQQGGFNLLASAIMTQLENTKPDYDTLLNELYYDTEIAGQELSFGKKIMSWGVGYGFRPLDVVQREDRRLLYSSTLEGVPLIAWDYFADNGDAFTLAYINPLRGQNDDHLDEESLAMKYYSLWDNIDVHAVARLSKHNKGEAGLGFAHVVNDALEWHGSVLYQYRYHKRLNRLTEQGSPILATDNPMQQNVFNHGINALLGFTWTHSSGLSLLGEVWFDESAYSKTQWDNLRQLTESQLRQLETGTVPEAAIYNNIGASSQFFSQPNLLQQNLLLRLSHDGETTDTALDWLYTPEDGGWVLTASLKHERNRQNFELGLRTFGGRADSAYSAVPEDLMIYLSWQLAFSI
ncbi:MAG: hypothetical protein DRR08_12695 [Candidatus Parabeggiatoa sp. nov. 2]|nr:MAG: hypothetical protein B6247_08785 [Beggiatoa sp. 4572_84]RKZ59900.1 MAG: hypothetical protein DRR08_12695 [Gammaproteobacteria bacterium]